MGNRPDAVILVVMLNNSIRYLIVLSVVLLGCNHQARDWQGPSNHQASTSTSDAPTANEETEGDGKSPEQSWPELVVLDVSASEKTNAPLTVRFSIKSDGPTPLVLEQSQITLHIKDGNDPYLFVAEPVFADNISDPIQVRPRQTVEFRAEISADRYDKTKTWDKLPNGRYVVQVYLNSGKEQNFEFQWLGQTYSKEFPIKLPLD